MEENEKNMKNLKHLLVVFALFSFVPEMLSAQEKELYINYQHEQKYYFMGKYMPNEPRKIEVFAYDGKVTSRWTRRVIGKRLVDGVFVSYDEIQHIYRTQVDYKNNYLFEIDNSCRVILKEPLNLFQWKFKRETKDILGYPCYKATCSFRGRDYVAWATREIPFKAAPWKFHGLPGVVLEVYSTDGFCKWEAKSLEIRDQKTELKFPMDKWTIVKLGKYIKLLKARKQGYSESHKKSKVDGLPVLFLFDDYEIFAPELAPEAYPSD